jgi:hypothetical protein
MFDWRVLSFAKVTCDPLKVPSVTGVIVKLEKKTLSSASIVFMSRIFPKITGVDCKV